MSFFKYIAATNVAENSKKQIIDKKINKDLPIKEVNSFIKELAPSNKTLQGKKDRNQEIQKTKVDKKIDVDSTSTRSGPDIIYIDEQIKKNLLNKVEGISELRTYLGRLTWIISNSEDKIDVIQAKREINTVRKKIQDIEMGFEYSLYLLRTADILEEYKKLLEATKLEGFIKKYTERDETKIYRRNKLLLDYIRIAKEYINLDGYKQKTTKATCDNCHSTNLLPIGDAETSCMLVCECGATLEQLDDAPSFKDSERVNMSSRYTYTCRGHFVEAMNRFEGKQNTEIDEEIVEMLKKEVSLHRLTADTATKDHIYMFMTEKKLSDYYADINLIYFKITAKNPPDITEYRSELLEMHDQLEEAYLEVKEEERLNSLNVNWKLYKLLQLLGYECKKDDFFCLKTPTKQGEHEQKWYDMIEYLKRKYPTALTSYGTKRWRHIRTL